MVIETGYEFWILLLSAEVFSWDNLLVAYFLNLWEFGVILTPGRIF